MRTREPLPCVICKELVEQDTSTSVPRETCKRPLVDGVRVKSECEKEKNRRYQKAYRNGKSPKVKRAVGIPASVAMSSVKHLIKHKARKYKRRCLKCEKKFTGVGAYNRICNYCTVENARIKPLRGV